MLVRNEVKVELCEVSLDLSLVNSPVALETEESENESIS